VLLWTLYIAVEPFVRRHWPQVLVSLTNVLTGRARDPVVGRDVLIGAALGVAWVLMIRSVDLLTASAGEGFVNFTGDMDLLAGLRSTAGAVLRGVPYAIRNVLFYFFLLFLLRVFLRREWAAALAFATGFGLLSALSNDDDRWLSAALTFLYFGSGAFVVLRWGLLAFAVAAALLFCTEAHAQTWREYRYGGFAVQFPAEPVVESGTYATVEGTSVDARIYSARQDGALYRATVADLSGSRVNEEQALSEAIRHLTSSAEVVVDVPHRVNQVLGRQLSIVGHDGSRSAIALFYRGRRLYLIEGTILPTSDDLMSSNGVRFQQSLRFILNSARGDLPSDLRRAPRNLVDVTR